MIVEEDGGPLGAVIEGANVPDTKLLEATIEAIVVERPEPTPEEPQNLCLDKGYDNPTGHETTAKHHYIPHIRRIREEKSVARGKKKHKPRRWVGSGRWVGYPSAVRSSFDMTRTGSTTSASSNSLALCFGIGGSIG